MLSTHQYTAAMEPDIWDAIDNGTYQGSVHRAEDFEYSDELDMLHDSEERGYFGYEAIDFDDRFEDVSMYEASPSYAEVQSRTSRISSKYLADAEYQGRTCDCYEFN